MVWGLYTNRIVIRVTVNGLLAQAFTHPDLALFEQRR